MVTYRRFKRHCELEPEWAAAAKRISDINCRLGKGSKPRSKTHCPRGHPYSGENLVLSPEGRRCRICIGISHDQNRKLTEDQARRVLGALRNGETIASVTKAGRPTYIANHRALLLFRQKHPKVDKLIVKLSTANAKIHYEEATVRRWQGFRSAKIAPNADEVMVQIRDAVPIALPRNVRQDVIGAMALAAWEGRLQPRDIKRRAIEFVKAYYRRFDTRKSVSTDARLFADGEATLLDRLSASEETGLWDINMMASTGRRK